MAPADCEAKWHLCDFLLQMPLRSDPCLNNWQCDVYGRQTGMKIRVGLLAFLLMACSGSYTNAEIIGKYRISLGGGLDTIELKPGGVYIHSYRSKYGRVSRQSGTWDVESLQAGQTVMLNNFVSKDEDHSRARDISLAPWRTRGAHEVDHKY
jgi:hypothetical protein